MKIILVLTATLAVASTYPEELYNPAYDNFNAQELVDNVRMLRNYGNCFLDIGPCTVEATNFKKAIPEALKTSCDNCRPKQRELIRVVVRGFQNKLPALWEELVKKEDSKGEFKESFEKFLNAKD